MGRPRKPDTPTPSQRVRASEARRKADGGARKTVMLSPEGASASAALLRQRGCTFTDLVNQVLVDELQRS